VRQSQTYEELLEYAMKLETKIRQLEHGKEGNEKLSEQLKAAFLTDISHEIRTPMNAILGFSNLLNDRELSCDKREEYLDHIDQSSARLLQIIEVIIDISLIETGRLVIRKDQCMINQLMKDIYNFYNVERHRKGRNNIALLVNMDNRDEEFQIVTDQFRLHQVLGNLLNNAFKYTEKGIIEFGYQHDNEKNRVTFYVADSGQGILKEHSRVILGELEEPELPEDTKLDGGAGLGLTLTKGIVRLLGGKLWVESNAFNGSTFNFTIPCATVREMGSTTIQQYTNNLFIA
jgi:signal transduction histidine kinase